MMKNHVRKATAWLKCIHGLHHMISGRRSRPLCHADTVIYLYGLALGQWPNATARLIVFMSLLPPCCSCSCWWLKVGVAILTWTASFQFFLTIYIHSNMKNVHIHLFKDILASIYLIPISLIFQNITNITNWEIVHNPSNPPGALPS